MPGPYDNHICNLCLNGHSIVCNLYGPNRREYIYRTYVFAENQFTICNAIGLF